MLKTLVVLLLANTLLAGKGEIFSLQKIDCMSCSMHLGNALKNKGIIEKYEFDQDKVEFTVYYKGGKVQSTEVIAAAEKLGYVALPGPGKGKYLAAPEFPDNLDVRFLVKKGEEIDLNKYSVIGKVTLFDFYADWCGPCKELDKRVIQILQKNPDVALRKINMVNWNSPITKRYLKNVEGLPYVQVFGPKGKKVAEFSGLDVKKLEMAIEKARKKG